MQDSNYILHLKNKKLQPTDIHILAMNICKLKLNTKDPGYIYICIIYIKHIYLCVCIHVYK